MDAPEASIKPRDRLSFALFLVISMHATVILGLGFVWQTTAQRSPVIEVTLAQHNDRRAPEQADFIAQADQLGSGDAEEALETTTPRDAEVHANELHDVLSEAHLATAEHLPTPTAVSTVAASPERTSTDEPDAELPEHIPLQPPDDAHHMPTSHVASLEARRDQQLQTDARGPRIRRLYSMATRRTTDAQYLQAWTRQVESIGNLHYPEEARQRLLFGELRLLVTITADGVLQEVTILQSSGHHVLDDAAVRIVRLAAPFPPFPDEMRQDTDVLEIIRTWQFRRNEHSSSS
jgi:periplasmic protein TonB